jgi:hypothetical protein
MARAISPSAARPAAEQAAPRERATPIRWQLWTSALAITCAAVGLYWDISWHISIGRDTFWTPAHIAIQLCGVLAGISCGHLIFSSTFVRASPLREASVSILGLRGPLGAFIASWGGLAMIVSAPFDNWWHDAYGLDVRIVSPPHAVLGLGLIAVALGAMILIVGAMNRALGPQRNALDNLLLYVGGMFTVLRALFILEYSYPSAMHAPSFYVAVMLSFPLLLAAIAMASNRRWAATIMAAIYAAFFLGALWLVPLFPAQPRLGPVYNRVTHMVPLRFPLLVIAGAVALDLVRDQLAERNRWLQATAAGAAFFAAFALVQWPFANFLLSPAARNWFFGAHYFGYRMRPELLQQWYTFLPTSSHGLVWGMATALLVAIVATRIGFAVGGWMRRLRR